MEGCKKCSECNADLSAYERRCPWCEHIVDGPPPLPVLPEMPEKKDEPKKQLDWQVDLALLLAGPLIVTCAAWFRGSPETATLVSLVPSALFALVLTVRLIFRRSSSSGGGILLGFILFCALFYVIFSVSVFGCAVGMDLSNKR